MNKKLLMVRHAFAGNPDHWKGSDKVRPIDDIGEQQADWLVKELIKYSPIDRIYSSQYLRCWQTVLPLAVKLKLPVKESKNLNVGASAKDALKLVKDDQTVVICCHGDLGPKILFALGYKEDSRKQNKKGSYWIVRWNDNDIDFQYHQPPKFKDKK